MESTLLIIALTGFIAGAVHVLSGPDHLAAIAPLTADRPVRSWTIGLWWGIGHTSSVWVIGILVFFLRELIPIEEMSSWGERLVGIVLIGLGIWGMRKALSSRVHHHVHEHDGVRHAHFHIHDKKSAADHRNKNTHNHTHVSLNIGILHGFAGSSHFIAILPALALPGTAEAAGYIFGFGMGTIFAMAGFSWLMGMFMERVLSPFSRGYLWAHVTLSLLAIGIGFFWIIHV